MANDSFTRDEVILALDVLYSSETGRVRADAPEIQTLSDLLRRLPIHPLENRRVDFRSPRGVAVQLTLFLRSFHKGEKSDRLGSRFLEIAFEYENKRNELHAIAEAIRANEAAFTAHFGDTLEDRGFPEGVLLGHLHHRIEKRDGARLERKPACEVCGIQPALCYCSGEDILENHLLVEPTHMDATKKYRAEHFLTVCPSCHAALHRVRPWLRKDNCGDLLR